MSKSNYIKLFKKITALSLLVFVIISVGFAVYDIVSGSNPGLYPHGEAKADIPRFDSPMLVATYFYGNVRCKACRTIERYSEEAVSKFYDDQIKSGSFKWRIINMDEPQNEHFIINYNLPTKSLVISVWQNGKEVEWKVLDDVWGLYNNKTEFFNYLREEIDLLAGKYGL
ncbi:hypothetical protein JW877_07940 [bacterium]|nr:hypothetical protein [bacterium]